MLYEFLCLIAGLLVVQLQLQLIILSLKSSYFTVDGCVVFLLLILLGLALKLSDGFFQLVV